MYRWCSVVNVDEVGGDWQGWTVVCVRTEKKVYGRYVCTYVGEVMWSAM